MLTRRLRAARRAPSAVAIGVGYVPGHRLTFDTVSTGKRQSSGTCDMEATGDATDRLYGVLFSISKTDEKSLDREEGLDRGYRKKHDRCLHRHRHQTSGRVHRDAKRSDLTPVSLVQGIRGSRRRRTRGFRTITSNASARCNRKPTPMRKDERRTKRSSPGISPWTVAKLSQNPIFLTLFGIACEREQIPRIEESLKNRLNATEAMESSRGRPRHRATLTVGPTGTLDRRVAFAGRLRYSAQSEIGGRMVDGREITGGSARSRECTDSQQMRTSEFT